MIITVTLWIAVMFEFELNRDLTFLYHYARFSAISEDVC